MERWREGSRGRSRAAAEVKMDGLDRKIKYAADEGQMEGENEKNGRILER